MKISSPDRGRPEIRAKADAGLATRAFPRRVAAAALTVARDGAAGTPGFRIFTVDAGVETRLVGLTIVGAGPNPAAGSPTWVR
jgi:hypothetical protein